MNSTPRAVLEHHCLFCDPSVHRQEAQILLRSDEFYLFAGLGPIVEGYIIIAPYSCEREGFPFRSLADATPDQIDELLFLRGLVSDYYRERYGILGMHFEHGRAGSCLCPTGHTKHCFHAHLCCYPVNIPLWEEIPEYETIPIDGLALLADTIGVRPYLYIENYEIDDSFPEHMAQREKSSARVVLLDGHKELESQYLRKLLATRIEQPHLWDWEAHPDTELVQAHIQAFSEWLKTSKKYAISSSDSGIPQLDFCRSVSTSNSVGNDFASQSFYQLWSGREQYGAIGKFLAQFPDNKNPRPLVLDAGCGTGNYLNAFYHVGLDCFGIDNSDEMLKLARNLCQTEAQLHHEENRQEPRIEKMDAFMPEFPGGFFDGVWLNAVIVHLPRRFAPSTLKAYHNILKDDGILYISAQLGKGCLVRCEGRVFFYYTAAELLELFANAGFYVLETWGSETREGSLGCTQEKVWRHFLLRKSKAVEKPTLGDLGERRLIDHIEKRLSGVASSDVMLGIGDDCTALRPIPGEVIVVSTDPCPTPVINLLEDTADPWCEGWFSVVINLSDLGAMGARALGLLLAIEANEEMPLAAFDRFYDGVMEAADTFGCTVIGGNVKDAGRFNCVGTALGSVSPDRMLRRDAARAGEHILVLGPMGLFWAGIIHKLKNIALEHRQSKFLIEHMRRPWPRLREGELLSKHGLSCCAMDSSDGLIACFYEIARAGNAIDLHVDFADVEPDPLVARVASAADIDPRKLMLAWGDWQLVCTVAPDKLPTVQKVMADLECPVHVVGHVGPGTGRVFLIDETGTGDLNYLASERFTRTSYFSYGLEQYLQEMATQPLFSLTCKGHDDV